MNFLKDTIQCSTLQLLKAFHMHTQLLSIHTYWLHLVLRLTHHHLTELIKVHGTGSVLVKLGNDAVQLLVSEGGEQLGDEAPECVHGDESLTILVINPESVLQFPLHGLNVRILNKELGAKLTELPELDLSGPVLVNLGKDAIELLLAGPEAHGAEDLVQVISAQKFLFLGVEQVETVLETLDLINLQSSGLIDFFKLDSSVRVSLASHDDAFLGAAV